MSDWTDNPFGANDDNDNPFADASVSQAQSSVPEYNPFDQPTKPVANESVSNGAAAFGQSSTGNDDNNSSSQSSEALPAWAQEPSQPQEAKQQETPQAASSAAHSEEDVRVTQRELEYAERDRQARLKQSSRERTPNFPNFPQWMRAGCIQPCFHLNIKDEIPVIGQRITRLAYYSWMLLFFTLFWNFICCLAGLAGDAAGKGKTAGISAGYLVLFSPCSYYCWFHQLYTAFRKDSSLRFGWFFLVMGCQFLASAFFAIGIPGTGASGIWTAAKTTDKNAGAGILMFTGAGLWIFSALFHGYILQSVLKVYRMSGYTTADMQREAAHGIASNKAVQGAAKDAVFNNNN